jgi:nucleoside-diphosphate-sugar epimerase
MRNSALINNHMIDAAAKIGVERYFFSSSVCVYRDMEPGEPALDEDDAYPALPDNEYGWEKLYAERMALAYARHYPLEVRVARFQNCYGPEGTLRQAQGKPGAEGGRRAQPPSALVLGDAPVPQGRKVAMADGSSSEGGTIPVWGDGTAIRAYTYVNDLVEGVHKLMQSDLEGAASVAALPSLPFSDGPTIIGGDEYVTVDEVAAKV